METAREVKRLKVFGIKGKGYEPLAGFLNFNVQSVLFHYQTNTLCVTLIDLTFSKNKPGDTQLWFEWRCSYLVFKLYTSKSVILQLLTTYLSLCDIILCVCCSFGSILIPSHRSLRISKRSAISQPLNPGLCWMETLMVVPALEPDLNSGGICWDGLRLFGLWGAHTLPASVWQAVHPREMSWVWERAANSSKPPLC